MAALVGRQLGDDDESDDQAMSMMDGGEGGGGNDGHQPGHDSRDGDGEDKYLLRNT